MKKRVLAMLTAGILCAAALTACGNGGESTTGKIETGVETEGSSSEGNSFKIGVFQPLSGASAAYGIEARKAIEMAVNYINENGGFNGVPGEVIAYDTQCSVEEAVKIATKLVTEDKVDALIGSLISSEMFATGNEINQAEVYTLGLGTSASWMKEDWPYVFRAAINNGASMPATVELMEELGYKTVSVFYGQDDAALSTFNEFKTASEEAGIEIRVSESYDQGDTDFSAQVTNIVNSNPDCVFISVLGDSSPIIVKQLRQYGYNGLIFNKECFMDSQIAVAGEENSDYVAFVSPYVTYGTVEEVDIENVKEFIQMYVDTYGEINQTDCAYRGWDSVMVMWEASKIAGSNDSNALMKATNTISDMEGLGGTLDFTAGNREGYFNGVNSFVLKDGKSILWTEWLEDGGYDTYKSETGRDK